MIRLTALNDSSSKSSDEDENYIKELPQEVQEENVLKLYNEALLDQKKGNIKKAEEMYLQLLSSNLLKNVKPEEEIKIKKLDNMCPLYSKPSLMVKYSCLKNLALLSQKKELFSEALNYFIQALEVERSDITVWFQCGCVAMKLHYVTIALECFLKGLELSPKHWPSLDKSIICLYILNDYITCLNFISRAFAIDAYYTRGHVLRDYIFSIQPSIQFDIKYFYPKIELYIDKKCKANDEIKSKLLNEVLNEYNEFCNHSKNQNFTGKETKNFLPSKKIDSPTWVNLGEYILNIYKEIETSEQYISFLTSINLKKTFMEEKLILDGTETDTLNDKKLTEKLIVSKLSDTENSKELNYGNNDKKNKKNRGSALMEELLWSGKRRSARVRSSLRGNPEPLDVAEALRRILPRKLLYKTKQLKVENFAKECLIDEGSMDTMDLYKLFEKQESAEEKRIKEEQERNEVEQDNDKIVETEGYFGKKNEENDVLTFIESQNNNNIIDIVTSFVMTLKNLWKKTWPTLLPNIYIKLYELMRIHHPIEFEICSTEIKFKALVEESGSVLLYGELCLEHHNSFRSTNSNESKPSTNLPIIFLQNVMELNNRQEMFESKENYFEFLLRLYWLRCRIFLEKSETILAIAALNDVLACYELFPEFQSTILHLKNCRKHNIISKASTEEFLAYQSRKKSLAEVVRLYEEESYRELTEILKETFTTAPNTVSTYFKEQESELVDRQTQLSMLINGLYHLNEYKECIYWLETCCYEVLQKSLTPYKPGEEGESWMVTLDRFLVGVEDCLKLGSTTVTEALPQNKVSRFVQTLCHAICKELEDSDRPPCPARPWIMLNTILIGLEKQQKFPPTLDEDEEDENDIPSSVLILFTAHEYLGRREWCNCNESMLLFLIMDQVIPNIRNPEWSSFRETVQQHVEQAIYCLYAHPNKKTKARYLTDHNVNSIPLTWKRGIQLFDLFRPDEIPSYDSLRINLISSETEFLFRKIASLIPDEKDPAQISDKMNEFIIGKKNEVPDIYVNLPQAVKDLFYILGDYYFKTHEFAKAVKYLLMDLCANPERVDSWASMALSKASLLEQQLNSCDPLKDEVFQQDALSALRCYEHCLQLDNKQCALWIEYGSFVYTIHSFCSQRMKLESHSLSLEQFEELESTKNKMLDTAKQAFINANLIWYEVKDENERQDERWLHHYMLGKICEKNGDISYFNHYEKAAELLYENKAEFPSKVGYTTPQTLAIEALEVYYRVHVCVIKNLELNEGKPLDAKTRHLFNKHLNLCSKGPFAKQVSKEDLAKLKAKKLEAAQQEKNMKEVKAVLYDIISKIEAIYDKKEKIIKFREKTNELIYLETYNEPDKLKLKKEVTETLDINPEKEDTENVIGKQPEVKILEQKICEKDLQIEENMNNVEDEQEVLTDIEESFLDKEKLIDCTKLSLDSNKLSEDYFNTLKDLNNTKQGSFKTKKKRRGSQGSVSSTSCGSEDVRYEDESSSSSSSSESSASSQSSSSSSSESSQGQSDTNKELSKVTDDDEKQSDKEKYDNNPKTEREEKEQESKAHDSENNLLIRCLQAFETCALRFPQHYKSVYRLAHFYFRSKEHRDIGKCRDLLLGRYQTQYQNSNGIIAGLFAERKNTNFFNGIWRIPAGDVDRPGSFASHMSRSILLLMEVLRDLKDHKMLLEICLQLKKTPDSDKKYLRESERNQLSLQACNLTIQTLRKNVKDSTVMTLPIVLDCYRCYQKVQKHYSHKESSFGDVLLEAFKRLGKGDNCTFEQALKFCHSEVSTARNKIPKTLNCSQSLMPKMTSMKLKKQEKKKATPKPQIAAKTVQKIVKPNKCNDTKKKHPYNVIRTNLLPDSSYWSSVAKALSESKAPDHVKSNAAGAQMYADLLRTAALSAQQKEKMEKKIVDQIALKTAYDKLKSDLNQKISQDSCKLNPMYFPFLNYPIDYKSEKEKNIFNTYWNTSAPFSGILTENSCQNNKKSKLMKPTSVLKSNMLQSDLIRIEEAKQAKTNFTIEDILGKPSLPINRQNSPSSSLTKSIEEKIKRISKEVNITKCSSSQAMNLSTSRKNLVETGKRSYQENFSEINGNNTTIKKVCLKSEHSISSRADDIEVVVIDD